MQLRRAAVFALTTALAVAVLPAIATPTVADTVGAWIASLQFRAAAGAAPASDGAIRVHHDPGAYVAPFVGPSYFAVVPYYANEAVAGLLRSGHPARLEIAERWISWYLKHTLTVDTGSHPRGAILDHWYLADGSAETVCPPTYHLAPDPTPYCAHADADDATAGTFLATVGAYAATGGMRAARTLLPVKRDLETVADVMLALQDPEDGLMWALRLWPFKYLMDNSEVVEGLDAIATLEEGWGDAAATARYRRAAARARAGIASLIDPTTGLYGYAKDVLGGITPANLAHFYPDSVALVWPLLRGVTPAGGSVAQAQIAALDDAWDGAPGADWTTRALGPIGEMYPAVGHAALRAGRGTRSAAHAGFVVGCAVENGFPWPFTVGDAGWLLRTLSEITPAAPHC